MSINNSSLPRPCYESHALWMKQALVKPSGDLFIENLNRHLGSKRGVNVALAKHCGVDKSLVTRWRDGSTQPTINMLGKIASFCNVAVTELFMDDTDDRSTKITLDAALRMVNEAIKRAQSSPAVAARATADR